MKIEEILGELRKHLGVHIIEGANDVAAVPNTMNLHSLEPFSLAPNRARGLIDFESIDSLMDYADEHQTNGAALFASAPADGGVTGAIHAVMDWHSADDPGWGDHHGVFNLKFTPDFKAWRFLDGKPQGQMALGEFLEEHLDDVVVPNGLDLLEAVTRLSGKRNVSFESARRLDNGDMSLQWKEDTVANNGTFPSRFTIRIPVIVGAEEITSFEMNALLRYRIKDGALTFEVKFLKLEKVLVLAFKEVVDRLNRFSEKSGIPVYSGKIARSVRG